ncbi:MAG: response regulator [Gammaproteobacteria bacterium]|nr:MAG: response regulator [Gammaproteobacteria bacterium]
MPYSNPNLSRILVVDDDEMLNTLFCSFLNSKGFETLSASGITEAKAILRGKNSVDLILLDYLLNDGTGMDLLQPEALATYSDIAPVIMISSNEEPKFLEQCFASGVNDYIIKPVNLSLLALKVESQINSSRMQRLIKIQNKKLENFKKESEREEQIAKLTYEYLLHQNSYEYNGVHVWLQSFAAFSGDMMLVKKSPSGHLYFILADATGHGLAAAITIMPVVTIFNSMVAKGFHIQKIATEINRKLVTDTPEDRFVAAVLIEINPFRRELNVWNGAMPPVFWVEEGKVIHEFQSNHMALGILDETMFDASIATTDLPDEGFILAYSDGLIEQENIHKQPFSKQKLINILAQQPIDLLAELSSSLSQHAGDLDYSDDISVGVIRPKDVFNNFTDLLTPSLQIGRASNNTNCFSWNVKLCGRQLENCEIPPLCNHFLQQLGFDQQLCQKIFTVVAEMISNGLDHGVLNLSSSIKEEPDGFVQYFYARERRLKTLSDKDFIKLSIQWMPDEAHGHLIIEVEDSGKGYTPQMKANNALFRYSGRGNELIEKLSASVEIIPPGNKIRATIK